MIKVKPYHEPSKPAARIVPGTTFYGKASQRASGRTVKTLSHGLFLMMDSHYAVNLESVERHDFSGNCTFEWVIDDYRPVNITIEVESL